MQLLARDIPATDMQVVSVNPGPNFTDSAQSHGYKREDFQWNNGAYPVFLNAVRRVDGG